MHKAISLVHLNGGIALARGSFLINFRHLVPTSITLVVFGLTRLLVSRYGRSVLQEIKRLHDLTQLGYTVDTNSCHLAC